LEKELMRHIETCQQKLFTDSLHSALLSSWSSFLFEEKKNHFEELLSKCKETCSLKCKQGKSIDKKGKPSHPDGLSVAITATSWVAAFSFLSIISACTWFCINDIIPCTCY
jgi:hypothetical protein